MVGGVRVGMPDDALGRGGSFGFLFDVRCSEKELCLGMSMVHLEPIGLEYIAMEGQGRYHISEQLEGPELDISDLSND